MKKQVKKTVKTASERKQTADAAVAASTFSGAVPGYASESRLGKRSSPAS